MSSVVLETLVIIPFHINKWLKFLSLTKNVMLHKIFFWIWIMNYWPLLPGTASTQWSRPAAHSFSNSSSKLNFYVAEMTQVRKANIFCSVADQRSRIRCLFDPWTRIQDLGSQIPTPYFLELSDKFLGKKFYNSLKTVPKFFLQNL